MELKESFSYDKVITYFLLALACIVAVLAYFSFMDGFAVHSEQKINAYIKESDTLLQETERLMEPLFLYANGEDYSPPLVEKEMLDSLRDRLTTGDSLPASKDFIQHKEAVSAVLAERYSIAYAYSLKIPSKEALANSFAGIDRLIEEENSELMESLKKADVHYDKQEDGTIRIYYKSYEKNAQNQ